LHLTPDLYDRLERAGVGRAEIRLHVDYGTFKPIRDDDVTRHVVDPVPFEMDAAAAARIAATRTAGCRIVAVGTTTTRTLEAVALEHDGRIEPAAGEAGLFIRPGRRFQVVDALLTNFHLLKSSLLLLVCAFAGRELILEAYWHAVEEGYRFYSYGDAMLVL